MSDTKLRKEKTSEQEQIDVFQAFQLFDDFNSTASIIAVPASPPQYAEHVCLIDSSDSYLMVPKSAILSHRDIGSGVCEFRVVAGAQAWRVTKEQIGSIDEARYGRPCINEESLPPPPQIRVAGDPIAGKPADQALLTTGVTIEGAAKLYQGKCDGGGSYINNCAHFLSDAFMRAGFEDFDSSHSCISRRCSAVSDGQLSPCTFSSAFRYRPIRAKEMRCWFATKSTAKGSAPENTGFYAVYQERVSDGQGHVVILDSNQQRYYGTGWFAKSLGWAHEYYKW